MKMDEDEGVQQEQARHVCKSCYGASYQVMPSFFKVLSTEAVCFPKFTQVAEEGGKQVATVSYKRCPPCFWTFWLRLCERYARLSAEIAFRVH